MKNIIITGTNEGIGLSLAQKIKDNYNILLIDNNKELLNNKDFSSLKNIEIKILDVKDRSKFELAINEFTSKFGELDLIVNNAGVMDLEILENQLEERIDNMLNTNLKGVINGTQLVINSMKKNKQGTIINVASTAGIYPYPEHAVYCGTKYGVRGFSQTMRKELASSNIRVITISPGAVKTNLLTNTTTNKQIIDQYLKWRDGNDAALVAEDVANAILFAYSQPQSVIIREIEMTSTNQVE